MTIEITDTVEVRERSDSVGLNVYDNVARLFDAYLEMNFKDLSGNNNALAKLLIGRDEMTLDDTLLLSYDLMKRYEPSYHVFVPDEQFLKDKKVDSEFLLIVNKLRISGTVEDYFKTHLNRYSIPKMEQKILLLGYVQFILFDIKKMCPIAYGDCDISVDSETSVESFLYWLSKEVVEKLPGF